MRPPHSSPKITRYKVLAMLRAWSYPRFTQQGRVNEVALPHLNQKNTNKRHIEGRKHKLSGHTQ